MDAANFYWENVQQVYARHRLFFEILWTTSLWMPYVLRAFGRMRTPKHAQYMKLPYLPLVAHVVLGTAVITRYYYLYVVTGSSPVPDLLDLILVLAFSAGSVQLSGYVHEGVVPVLKATFQSASFQQAIAITVGYAYGDAKWHRASVKLLDSFVWVRWLSHYGPLLQGFSTYGARFTASVFISHPLSLWEGDYPAGLPVFVAMLCVLLAVDKWASRKLDGTPGPIPRALAYCGFVTVQRKHREMSIPGVAEAESEAAGVKQE